MHHLLGEGRSVRDGGQGDLPAIVAIYNSAIPGRLATADTEPVAVADRTAWFEAHGPHRRPLWVLEAADGELEGWLSFSDFYGRPAYAGTAELSIYVQPGRQGRGVGATLLDLALEAAPGLGLEVLLAFVFGHNEPSLRLFSSRGFERWAHLPGVARLDGEARDLVILGRRAG